MSNNYDKNIFKIYQIKDSPTFGDNGEFLRLLSVKIDSVHSVFQQEYLDFSVIRDSKEEMITLPIDTASIHLELVELDPLRHIHYVLTQDLSEHVKVHHVEDGIVYAASELHQYKCPESDFNILFIPIRPKQENAMSQDIKVKNEEDSKKVAVASREWLIAFQKQTFERIMSITVAKNNDYAGKGGDAFNNFSRVNSLFPTITTEEGFCVRMMDKFSRISSFLESGSLMVKDESVEDTLLDLSNYAFLMYAYVHSKKLKEQGITEVCSLTLK